MNNSVLIPVMVIFGTALITGLVIIPEIADSQSQSTEEIDWATGCELNVYVDDNGTEIEYMVCFDDFDQDLKKLDKIIENQEIIKDQLSEIYDINS